MSEQQLVVQPTNQAEALPSTDGSATELGFFKPFEGFIYIRKEWVDQEDGIEKVSFHFTLSHLNLPADWAKTENFVMMPQWGSLPLKRTWIVRLPTHFEGSDRYLFHYFFQAHYTNGSERVSNTFTQMVLPQQFEFIDHSGEMLFVRLHWSIGNWTYPQDTEMEVNGIEWGSESSVSNAPYRLNDRLYHSSRILLMRRLPVPHRFRGLIWAPKGSEIKYCFQMLKPALDVFETNWDNNFGKDYSLTI